MCTLPLVCCVITFVQLQSGRVNLLLLLSSEQNWFAYRRHLISSSRNSLTSCCWENPGSVTATCGPSSAGKHPHCHCVSQLTLLLLLNYTSHFIITADYVTYSSHVLLEFCYSHRFRTGCKPDGVAVGSEMTEPHVCIEPAAGRPPSTSQMFWGCFLLWPGWFNTN